MRKSLINKLLLIFFSIIFLGLVSCSTSKKIKYFQDIPDSGQTKTLPATVYAPLIIQPGDILNLTNQTIDPLSSAGLLTAGNVVPGGTSSMPGASGGLSSALSALSGGSSTEGQAISGYLVGKDGNIDVPLIGKIKAAGLNTEQLKDLISSKEAKFFKDPIVTVRYANFKVNVTGEVLKPGQYIMPDEKENVMDALAMAGDLTVFGKRENVLLVRENSDGTRTAYRLNLKKSEVLSSPLFYLRQNDLIYVEPRKAKSDATDASQARYITIASAILSLLIVLGTRAK